jgi:hypothetical protein
MILFVTECCLITMIELFYYRPWLITRQGQRVWKTFVIVTASISNSVPACPHHRLALDAPSALAY